MLRRYVHGDAGGALRQAQGDRPLVWYEGGGVGEAARRDLFADERGSIVAVTDAGGNVTAVNTYDEYGIPAATNTGRFQYTGQAWLPELGLYYYKARLYSPTLGRFLQTDPIGYDDGPNIYAYVENDPVNRIDPSGKSCVKLESGAYSCRVDLNSGKFNERAIRAINAAYTAAVNRLASRSDAETSITVGGKTIVVSAGQVARSLANATIDTRTVGRNDSRGADTRGGALTPDQAGRMGRSVITITNAIFMRPWNSSEKASSLINAFAHEGIHSDKKLERPFFEQYYKDPNRFNTAHQTPYSKATNSLLGDWP
jgi:RHS repeat-associated protein